MYTIDDVGSFFPQPDSGDVQNAEQAAVELAVNAGFRLPNVNVEDLDEIQYQLHLLPSMAQDALKFLNRNATDGTVKFVLKDDELVLEPADRMSEGKSKGLPKLSRLKKFGAKSKSKSKKPTAKERKVTMKRVVKNLDEGWTFDQSVFVHEEFYTKKNSDLLIEMSVPGREAAFVTKSLLDRGIRPAGVGRYIDESREWDDASFFFENSAAAEEAVQVLKEAFEGRGIDFTNEEDANEVGYQDWPQPPDNSKYERLYEEGEKEFYDEGMFESDGLVLSIDDFQKLGLEPTFYEPLLREVARADQNEEEWEAYEVPMPAVADKMDPRQKQIISRMASRLGLFEKEAANYARDYASGER